MMVFLPSGAYFIVGNGLEIPAEMEGKILIER
jgi:hypothetical protein